MFLSVLDVYRVKGRGLIVATDLKDQKVNPGDILHRGEYQWSVEGIERASHSTRVGLILKPKGVCPDLRKGQALSYEVLAQSRGNDTSAEGRSKRIARSEVKMTAEQTQTQGNGAGEEEKEETQRPTLTKSQKKALFDAADKAGRKEADAERVLKAAQAEKSEAIRKIYNALGKGPFKWRDEVLTITKRGETYFFRGRTQADVEDIG